ncbi:hypothetical protein CDIK_3473 [Cucumispora dikerogammari]|nr:hypothetical protein CDIK_3473 [Cucumispora dikerogammari]
MSFNKKTIEFTQENLITKLEKNSLKKLITKLEQLETKLDTKIIKTQLNNLENSLNRPMKQQTLKIIIEPETIEVVNSLESIEPLIHIGSIEPLEPKSLDSICPIDNIESIKEYLNLKINFQILEENKIISKNITNTLNKLTIKTEEEKYKWKNSKKFIIETFNCKIIKPKTPIFLELEILNTTNIFQLKKTLKDFLFKNKLFPFKFSSKSEVILNIWKYSKRNCLLNNDVITLDFELKKLFGDQQFINLNDVSKKIQKFFNLIKIQFEVNKEKNQEVEVNILVDNLINFNNFNNSNDINVNIDDINNQINELRNQVDSKNVKLLALEKEKFLLTKFLEKENFLFDLLTRT